MKRFLHFVSMMAGIAALSLSPVPPAASASAGSGTNGGASADADSVGGGGNGGGGTGLPLPRFVSLRSEPVNLRTGPGQRYPVEWTYLRRGYPVEIIAEFDTWRKIRDWEGTEGWVHQSMLAGRRTFLVMGSVHPLRGTGSEDASPVAMVEPGVVGMLMSCPKESPYCRVNIGGRIGWLKRSEFWGIHRGEFLN
ncbi:MAG: SH3 domain-containing protein [Alphaproteobacteria bacterium]